MKEVSKEELAIILDKHAKYLNGGDGGERADLSDADLSDADLRSADLRSANLRYANLRSANLRYANLRYADLSSADLRSANLSSANLRYANLRYADLRSANLRYANLSYADLRSADLRDADLRSADLRSATGQYFITQRADGYQFFLVLDEDGRWYIRAGCQYMSIEDYRKHTESYGEESKKAETNLILDFAEAKLNSAIKASEKAA